jgi:P4 family phage/plasmid primase-like protien
MTVQDITINLEEINKEYEVKYVGEERARWECQRCGNIYLVTPPHVCECRMREFKLKDFEEATKFYCNNPQELTNTISYFFYKKLKSELSEILVAICNNQSKYYATRFDDRNEIYCYENGIYVSEGRTKIKEIVRKLLGKEYTEQFGNQVVNKIEADSYITQDELFKPKNINEICLLNGILNLKTRELTPFTPNKIFFSKIQANYDPQSKCKKITKFLNEVLPDKQDVKTVYEIVGFCLYREYFVEKAVMMLGTGRNGKGKTISLIKKLLGDENFTGIPLQKLENGDFKEVELMGKLANLGGDVSNYPLKDTAKFKGLTGRDTITASKKFKNDVSFENYAKMIFATNTLPKTYDLTNAFFSRWVYLNFPFEFKPKAEYLAEIKKDSKLKEKYKVLNPNRINSLLDSDEMSGFLNEALSGLDRLFSKNDFTSSKSSSETKHWWIRNSDSFLAFTIEKLEIADSELEFIKKDVLRKNYQAYCKEHRVPPEGDKHIHEMMIRQVKAWDSQLSDDSRERVWKGVKFKSSQEERLV